ncbi:MAG: pyridoxal phosphate-dependent aminotransferase [Gemmatimonadetes bacterium]|nr:pyridoxal phosphate-dependent aminotransferase [Gemmatimonadota bacterium]
MRYVRMPIEVESPEQVGYDAIRYNLCESSMRDRTVAELGLDLDVGRMLLLYGDHRGHSGLRALLAAEGGCDPDQVLLTTGAAGALFIVSTTLLEAGDHLVVLRPNYATNIETPRAIGAQSSYVELTFEDGWQWSVDQVAAAMTPRTRLVSVTTPHNPTGVVVPREQLARLAELVAARGAHLLVDETYRDLTIEEPAPFATTLGPHVISVASLSKAYGLPGLRLGWLMTRDPALNERFLAAKEQIFICGPVLDEELAYRVYARRATERPVIAAGVAAGRAIMRDWIARETAMEWVEPAGGVVCFPRIRPDAPVDVARFYAALTGDHRTWVGPGHWFEQHDRYMRIGFGWPTADELRGGLAAISASLRAATL